VNQYEFDDPYALGETPKPSKPTWMSVATGPVEPMGPQGGGAFDPMGPYGALPPSTGDSNLDRQFARVAEQYPRNPVPEATYGTLGEQVAPLGQIAGIGAQLATSSYAEAYGIENPIIQELTRPINYFPIGKGVGVARAAGEAVGGRLAVEAAQPLVEKLPEGVRPIADLGINMAGQVATGKYIGAAQAGKKIPFGMSIDDVSDADGFARNDPAEVLRRTNKIRESRGLPPLDAPSAPTQPLAQLDEAVAEIRKLPAPDREAIIEGMDVPAPVRAQLRKAVDDAEKADIERLSQVFKSDTPAWQQEPPPPRPDLFTPEVNARLEGVTARQVAEGKDAAIERVMQSHLNGEITEPQMRRRIRAIEEGPAPTRPEMTASLGSAPEIPPSQKAPAGAPASGSTVLPDTAGVGTGTPAGALTPPEAKVLAEMRGVPEDLFQNNALWNPEAGYRQPIGWDEAGRPNKWLTAQGTIEGLTTRTDAPTPRITPAESAEIRMGGRTGESMNIPTRGAFSGPNEGWQGSLEGARPSDANLPPAPSSFGMANQPQNPALIPSRALEDPLVGNAGPAPDLTRVLNQDEAFRNKRMDIGSGGPVEPPKGPPTNENLSFGGLEPPPPPKGSWGDTLKSLAALPQTLKSTLDLSAPRQLSKALYAHPTTIPATFRSMIQQLRSQGAYEASVERLSKSPNKVYRDIAKVDITELGENAAKREEAFGSNIAESIPVLGRGVKATNRAFTGAINEMREWLFDYMLKQVDRELLTEAGLKRGGTEELERIGRFVNASTGRGNLGETLNQNAILGQPLLFAPRYLASQIQVPGSVFSKSAIVRKEAARQTAAFVGANTALLGAIKASGVADVELDPRSSDFGQIRIGDRRYDVWAGMRPIATLIARTGAAAAGMENTKGINSPTGPGTLYDKPALDVITAFLRTKLAPIPGEVVNQYLGKNIVGSDVTRPLLDKGNSAVGRAENAILGLFAPIFAENIAEELGYAIPRADSPEGKVIAAAKAALANIPYFVGLGGGEYVPDADERARRGEFKDLRPRDQFEAIPAQSWESMEKKGYKSAKDFKSYNDWKGDWVERATAKWEPKLGKSEAKRQAELAVEKTDTAKYYKEMNTTLENWWYKKNPELGKQLYDAQMEKFGPDRRNMPTSDQRKILQAAK